MLHPFILNHREAFSGQCKRHLVNCDNEHDFRCNIQKLKENLCAKGYNKRIIDDIAAKAIYDQCERRTLLLQYDTRTKSKNDGEENNKNNKLVFITTYSHDMQAIGIKRIIKKHLFKLQYSVDTNVINFKAIDFVIAYRSGVSMFRTLYTLNKPWKREGGIFM